MKQQKQKYSSVSKLINLPPIQSLQASNKHQFQKNQPTIDEGSVVDLQLTSIRDQLIDKLEQKIDIFSVVDFDFKFPISKFPDVPPGLQNKISYQQKMQAQYEDTFADRLTPEQVQQIRDKGQFEVASKSYNSKIPYVWKVNNCLLKGKEGRINIWEQGWAWCYQFLLIAKDFFVETIPSSLKSIVKIPVKYFDLIFGRRRLRSIYSPNYERQADIEFWQNILDNQLRDLKDQVGHQLFECLYVYYDPIVFKDIPEEPDKEKRKALEKQRNQRSKIYNDKIEKINKFKSAVRQAETDFENNWKKVRKNILNKISNQVEDYKQKSMMNEGDQQPLSNQLNQKKDQTITEKFIEQKYLIYIAHLKENLHKTNVASQAVISALLTLVTIFNIIDSKISAKQKRKSQIQIQTRQQIRKKYSIRSRIYQFVEDKITEICVPIFNQIDLETDETIVQQLSKLPQFNQKYRSIMKKYLKYKKQFNDIIEVKKKNLKSLYVADRIFDSFYILFPPYEVIKSGSYYSLKKTQVCQIDTSTHFWKCLLYAMRLKCWSLNCLKTCIGLSWASPLGFRCLFGINDFAYDEDIQSSTGRKIERKRSPFLGVFCVVLEGIKRSRDEFQGKPDLGILGKNCSRICNLIQCYIFRFIFVGLIGVLMLYPVAIILFSSICFIGVLTFWIWTPLALILVYLFNILVFQFQISRYDPGCLIRGIPLLSIAFQLIFHVLKIVASFLFLLVIAPLICLLYIFFLVIQRGMRTCTDTVMACLLGCCGRTPSVDTCIATKVSGPGMSRSYFYSIAEQDVYILVQAALQKTLMRKINDINRQQLQINKRKYQKICRYVLKPFGYTRADIHYEKDKVQQNYSKIIDNYSKKYNNYMNRYPRNPHNIRFTQQQMQVYFENSIKIVKNYIEKNSMEDWIFNDKDILNEDYDQLTRKLWSQIFGSQIFQPLENIDTRFKLESEGSHNQGIMRQNVSSISKAIKGQVDLSSKNVKFSPAKRSVLDKDSYMNYIQKIFSIHESNSQNYISVNKQNSSYIFVPHRNLKELKEYDNYCLETARRGRNKIFEY